MLLMGKSTISMAMFNSFLYVYQRVNPKFAPFFRSKKRSKHTVWRSCRGGSAGGRGLLLWDAQGCRVGEASNFSGWLLMGG